VKKLVKSKNDKLLDNVIEKLERLFALTNKENAEAALLSMQLIKTITGLKDTSEIKISPRTKAFAAKYKPMCDEFQAKVDEEGLEYLVFLSDNTGDNMITAAHMTDENIVRSISGTVFKSDMLAQTVLKGIGIPDKLIPTIMTARKKANRAKRRREEKKNANNN
jgi:hypothetical protein